MDFGWSLKADVKADGVDRNVHSNGEPVVNIGYKTRCVVKGDQQREEQSICCGF
jgi:hypothetical protein